jgi:hypothetical protein
MALRLIEMVLTEQEGEEVLDLSRSTRCSNTGRFDYWTGKCWCGCVTERGGAGYLLGERYAGKAGNRVVILAVEAKLPRDELEPGAASEQAAPEEKSPERISREEMYEDI